MYTLNMISTNHKEHLVIITKILTEFHRRMCKRPTDFISYTIEDHYSQLFLAYVCFNKYHAKHGHMFERFPTTKKNSVYLTLIRIIIKYDFDFFDHDMEYIIHLLTNSCSKVLGTKHIRCNMNTECDLLQSIDWNISAFDTKIIQMFNIIHKKTKHTEYIYRSIIDMMLHFNTYFDVDYIKYVPYLCDILLSPVYKFHSTSSVNKSNQHSHFILPTDTQETSIDTQGTCVENDTKSSNNFIDTFSQYVIVSDR
jgi:hypothetical protein